jgi:hypothetical protein
VATVPRDGPSHATDPAAVLQLMERAGQGRARLPLPPVPSPSLLPTPTSASSATTTSRLRSSSQLQAQLAIITALRDDTAQCGWHTEVARHSRVIAGSRQPFAAAASPRSRTSSPPSRPSTAGTTAAAPSPGPRSPTGYSRNAAQIRNIVHKTLATIGIASPEQNLILALKHGLDYFRIGDVT